MRISPFFGVLRREVLRYLKVPYQTIGSPLINSLLYLFIFGLSLGRSISLPGYPSYLLFLIPGLIMMASLKNAYDNAASSCVSSKYAGELIDLRYVPLTISHIAWGYALAGLSRGVIVAFLTYAVGFSLVLGTQGQTLPIAHPWVFLYFLVIAGLAFSSLGLAVGMWAKNFDALTAINTFLLMPLIYFGGVFFSLDSLHPFWQKASHFNPIFYMISGIRYGLLGISDVNLGLAAIFSFGCFLLFHSLAFFALRKGTNYHW
ncbi:MAG: ABC transporter permease [Chlamydiales bacterium]|nr:ABC transporter permease [Chlamydiales bacterium]